MKRVLGYVFAAVLLLGCAPLRAPSVTPFADGQDWVLREPLQYRIGSTSLSVSVPAGFITDYASIPRCMCLVLPKMGRYNSAAIVHDFLYWDQSCPKDVADRVLLLAMLESGVSPLHAAAIYAGVDKGGSAAWNENENKRQGGAIRVLPPQYADLPPGLTWPQYAERLKAQGVMEPAYERPSRAFCDGVSSIPLL